MAHSGEKTLPVTALAEKHTILPRPREDRTRLDFPLGELFEWNYRTCSQHVILGCLLNMNLYLQF
jgi:hypothetical protein